MFSLENIRAGPNIDL